MTEALHLAYLLGAFATTGAVVQDETERFPRSDVDFNFGDDCETLGELSFDALLTLTVAADDQTRQRFCAVVAPEECDDYDWAIDGFGTLAPARTPGFCRFVPRPMRHDLPVVFKSYG